MAVPQLGTGTNTLKTASTTNSSAAQLQTDYDDFLKLLTTQLKNQDPTSPMETNEFTQQIIGFSQVEQAVNTNTNLEKLIEANKTSAISNAVSYVDQIVVAETDEFNLKKSTAYLGYELPSTAKSTTITIKDEKGKVINNYAGQIGKGEHKMLWDGKDKKGNVVADGKYSISVTALDDTGTVIENTKTYVTDLVSQVDLQGDSTTLYFNDISFSMDKIKSIKGYTASS